jgi:hypothetical protein
MASLELWAVDTTALGPLFLEAHIYFLYLLIVIKKLNFVCCQKNNNYDIYINMVNKKLQSKSNVHRRYYKTNRRCVIVF